MILEKIIFNFSLWGIIAALGIFYMNNRHNKLLLFNDLVHKLAPLDKEIQDLADSDTPLKKKKELAKNWDSRAFNFIEYTCYLGNKSLFMRFHILDFLSDTIISFYQMLKKYNEKDYLNPKKYSELKKFIRKYMKGNYRLKVLYRSAFIVVFLILILFLLKLSLQLI